MSNKCPVCKEELGIDYRDYLDGHTLCEEMMSCPKCDYTYEYAYGNFRESVLGEEFGWSYTATPEEIEKIQSQIQALISKKNDDTGSSDQHLKIQ